MKHCLRFRNGVAAGLGKATALPRTFPQVFDGSVGVPIGSKGGSVCGQLIWGDCAIVGMEMRQQVGDGHDGIAENVVIES